MRQLAFEDLARLPLFHSYAVAFRAATGVSLRIVPPDESQAYLAGAKVGDHFCALVGSTREGCLVCQKVHGHTRRKLGEKPAPHQIQCFAGLLVAAAPVVIGGKHVATLMSGQVCRREPTENAFQRVVNRVGAGENGTWEARMRSAYFETPVVTAERFEGVLYLLTIFARYLADHASQAVIACAKEDPHPVAGAKKYVESHVQEPLLLKRVVQHVHVSRFYFCKLFKKTTGMTLTEYVSRVRVEKAKALLVNPSLRITDIVYASGFGSIPRFNSVFKRYVGMAPTQYRASLRSHITKDSPSLFSSAPDTCFLTTPISKHRKPTSE